MNDPIERFIEACEGYRDRNHRIQWLFTKAKGGSDLGFTDEWEEQVRELTEEMHAHRATISHLAGDVASVVKQAGEDAKPVFALVREAEQNDIYNFGRLWCTTDVLPILRIAALGRPTPEADPNEYVRMAKKEVSAKTDRTFRTLKKWAEDGKFRMTEIEGTRDVWVHRDDLQGDP